MFRPSVRPCVRASVRLEPFLRHAWTDLSQTWYNVNTLWHTYARQFISRSDPIWPPGGHLVPIAISHTTPRLILFKLGTRTTYYDLCMHINLYYDLIQYGRQTAILFSFFHVLCDYVDMPRHNFFKPNTRTGYHIIHVRVILFCDPIQYGRQSAILFSFFHVLCLYTDMP